MRVGFIMQEVSPLRANAWHLSREDYRLAKRIIRKKPEYAEFKNAYKKYITVYRMFTDVPSKLNGGYVITLNKNLNFWLMRIYIGIKFLRTMPKNGRERIRCFRLTF